MDSFNMTQMAAGNLVDSIANNTIILPDLQRPFVWPKSKVRDLFDSMYRGYPVGELMFWLGGPTVEEGKSISGETSGNAQYAIIDGQQRLTSLFAVIKREEVKDADYQKKKIVIAFEPFEEKFEVLNASIKKNSSWVPDIADVFSDSIGARRRFLQRWEDSHGGEALDLEREARVERSLTRVSNLLKYPFSVVTLLEGTSKETVADIFVRINSEGVPLNAADFILTWFSVFWPEGREAIERFARHSRISTQRATEIEETIVDWTPLNHFLKLSAGQLVRLLVAVGQNRGPLSDAYAVLQAKNSDGGADTNQQNEELKKLENALPLVTKRIHWDEFWKAIQLGGFRSYRMTTSNNNLLYSYVMFILGREKFNVELPQLRRAIARWFFMCQITGRFTGSPESKAQRELDALADLSSNSGEAFLEYIERVIRNELSDDFWTLRMPEALASSGPSISPTFQAYLASLNVMDADLFMISLKVHDWMDPTISAEKGTELHHLFPRAYLEREYGITDVKRRNQIANFAPTDWKTNQTISDKPPGDYWPALVEKQVRDTEMLQKHLFWHALPSDWYNLEYNEFLEQRRILMAEVTRAGFEQIGQGLHEPVPNRFDIDEVAQSTAFSHDVADLVEKGLLSPGETLVAADASIQAEGFITADLNLNVNSQLFDDLDFATKSFGLESVSGLDFWAKDVDGERITIRELVEAASS